MSEDRIRAYRRDRVRNVALVATVLAALSVAFVAKARDGNGLGVMWKAQSRQTAFASDRRPTRTCGSTVAAMVATAFLFPRLPTV